MYQQPNYDEEDLEEQRVNEGQNDNNEYYYQRRPRNRARTNLIAAMALLGVGVLILGIGVYVYYILSSNKTTDPNAGLSAEEIVNQYNAKHGMTINGETLTPTGGSQPVGKMPNIIFPSTTQPNAQVASLATSTPWPQPSGKVEAPFGPNCWSGQITSFNCANGQCTIELSTDTRVLTLPQEYTSGYAVGVTIARGCSQ